MPAIFQNFLSGTLTADPGAGGATLTSAELVSMATVASPDFMWVTLDPAGVYGDPEVVKVTTHAGAGGTAAVTRAQQGTTARAHPVGTVWKHAWTRDDALLSTRLVGLEAGLPAASAALEGYTYYATDTDRTRECAGVAGWVIMSEPWQTYTPTATNLTIGGGTISGRYRRSDGWIDVVIQAVFGASTPSMGTGPYFTLPVNAESTFLATNYVAPIGQFTFYDATGSPYGATATYRTASTVEPRYLGASGLYSQWTATVPVAAATTDAIVGILRYPMATRYS